MVYWSCTWMAIFLAQQFETWQMKFEKQAFSWIIVLRAVIIRFLSFFQDRPALLSCFMVKVATQFLIYVPFTKEDAIICLSYSFLYLRCLFCITYSIHHHPYFSSMLSYNGQAKENEILAFTSLPVAMSDQGGKRPVPTLNSSNEYSNNIATRQQLQESTYAFHVEEGSYSQIPKIHQYSHKVQVERNFGLQRNQVHIDLHDYITITISRTEPFSAHKVPAHPLLEPGVSSFSSRLLNTSQDTRSIPLAYADIPNLPMSLNTLASCDSRTGDSQVPTT